MTHAMTTLTIQHGPRRIINVLPWKSATHLADGHVHLNATLANALTRQPQVVRIDPADIAFKTSGCQPWQLTDGAAPPAETPPWLSQMRPLRRFWTCWPASSPRHRRPLLRPTVRPSRMSRLWQT